MPHAHAVPFQSFNAAETLALSEGIRGRRGENALLELELQRERDPGSVVNRARQVGLEAGQEELQALRTQNLLPQLSTALEAIGSVRETIGNKGVSVGRHKYNERMSFLRSKGILDDDFEAEDISQMSDDEFLSFLDSEEESINSTLDAVVPFVVTDRAAPSSVREMQTFGYPLTPEGFKQFNEDRGSGTQAGLDALLAEARLLGLIRGEGRAQAQEEREEQERQQERTAQEQSIVRNLEQGMEAVRLTERLEGTILESGIPASDFRRGLASLGALAGSLTGRDTSELTQTIGDFDTQRKILQDQVNSRIASGDFGRSATQLQSIQRSLASPDISAAAIIRIQGQLGQIDLDRADALDIKIPNRKEFERRVKEWKSYDPVSANIPRMSEEQIRQLDIDSLTDQQAEAVIKRLDELGQ